MFEEDDWYFREAQELTSFVSTVTGRDLLVLVDQNWCGEAKCLDAFGDSPNLPAGVFAGIGRVGRSAVMGRTANWPRGAAAGLPPSGSCPGCCFAPVWRARVISKITFHPQILG